MKLEKKVIAKAASLSFLALSLAAIPEICNDGCATVSSKNNYNFERNSQDNPCYLATAKPYNFPEAEQNYK